MFELENTCRGFNLITFKDRYGDTCQIQESSLASEPAIWFGVADACPKVMASQAASLGVDTTETCGWVTYPIPEEVLLSTRMHLTVDQVKAILPILENFVETGEVSLPESS